MNQKDHVSTKFYKVDTPKDHEGLSFGCTGPQVNGETKNGAMDNKELNDFTKAYILIVSSNCFTHIVHTLGVQAYNFNFHVHSTLVFHLSSSFYFSFPFQANCA